MKRNKVHIEATTKVHQITREGRIVIANMITRQFDLWQLDVQAQLSLLGLSKNSMATLRLYRKGAPLANRRDLLDRVTILLSINMSLRELFPQNRELSDRWPTTPNRVFGGVSPVEFIGKEGFSGLMAVKRYLNTEKDR